MKLLERHFGLAGAQVVSSERGKALLVDLIQAFTLLTKWLIKTSCRPHDLLERGLDRKSVV